MHEMLVEKFKELYRRETLNTVLKLNEPENTDKMLDIMYNTKDEDKTIQVEALKRQDIQKGLHQIIAGSSGNSGTSPSNHIMMPGMSLTHTFRIL